MTFEVRLQTRWPDFDGLGHLNHAVYHVYLDEARDDALRRTVGDFASFPNVVVHASIDYKKEIAYGAREVVVQSTIARVGRSSVRFRQVVLTPDGEVAAESESVLVAWDPAARSSRTIGDDERRALLAGGSDEVP
ncbi:MAG TPA: thioesterase family protein [Gaiellaceae bacterium]|nr:thioesterase family protein [Gaiellaceae bacterium]